LRNGEALGLCIVDISLERRELMIHRRPIANDEQRNPAPSTRTLGRLLPLDEELCVGPRAERASVGDRTSKNSDDSSQMKP